MTTSNRVRALRARAGLAQGAVAAAAGLTRQSLSAIEAGRATPSVLVALRIAAAIGVRVEDLYGAPAAPVRVRVEGPVPPGPRVALAEIGGRWVASALDPSDAARAADALVTTDGLELLHAPERARETVFLSGCAPALGVLAERLDATAGAGIFRWIARSSTVALEDLLAARTHVAGMHWVDERTGEANVPEVRRRAAHIDLVLVTLAHWEAGIVVAKGNPHRIRAAADLARPKLRLVLRERGSGARRLLERELRKAKVPRAIVRRGNGLTAHGHLEVAQAIALGAADAGLATRDAALAYDLGFVPIARERFDLVLSRELLAEPRGARIGEVLASAPARRELAALGYDVAHSGDVAAEVRAA